MYVGREELQHKVVAYMLVHLAGSSMDWVEVVGLVGGGLRLDDRILTRRPPYACLVEHEAPEASP